MYIVSAMFEYGINLFQAYLLLSFLTAFFGSKYDKYTTNRIMAVCTFVLSCFITLVNHITVFEGLAGYVYSLLCFLFAFFLLEGKWIKKAVVAVFMISYVILVSTGISYIVGTLFQQTAMEIYREFNVYRAVAVIMVQFILYFTKKIVLQFHRKTGFYLQRKEIILILIVTGISSSIFILLIYAKIQIDFTGIQAFWVLMFLLGLIGINFIVYYLIVEISKSNQKRLEMETEQQRLTFEKSYMKVIEQQYEEVRRIRHDIRQTYQVMEGLLSSGKIEEIEKYLRQEEQQIEKIIPIIRTNNEYVNAILNLKLSYAKNLGIQTWCELTDGLDGVEDNDWCNLLGNLLDNAIEACAKCSGEKYIEISIERIQNYYTINVSNTLPEKISIGKKLGTTKLDKANHGYGMKTIQKITDKYKGTFDKTVTDAEFQVKIVLFV